MSLTTEHLHGRQLFLTRSEWITVLNAFDVFHAVLTNDPDLDDALVKEFQEAFDPDKVKQLASRIASAPNPSSNNYQKQLASYVNH